MNRKRSRETALEPDGHRDAPAPDLENEDQVSPDEGGDKQVNELKDRLLRALAEQENMRRRFERDIDQAVTFAASGVASDLLPVADNLRLALESLPEGKAHDRVLQGFLDGVAATERALLSAFEKHGIRRIVPLGEHFDPNLHHAMFSVSDSPQPSGTVVEVVQPGYLHHDRLLRPAAVGVAVGNDAPAADPRTADPRTADSQQDHG